MYAQPIFPKCFSCYTPAKFKVYGCVCMTLDNKILLVKGKKTGKWSFPKGHREVSESYLECALRETREETGVDLKELKAVAYHRLSVGEYFFYEVGAEMPITIEDTTEIQEAKWLYLNELPDIECNVDVNNFLHRIGRFTSR